MSWEDGTEFARGFGVYALVGGLMYFGALRLMGAVVSLLGSEFRAARDDDD
jgi:hypothetical protein